MKKFTTIEEDLVTEGKEVKEHFDKHYNETQIKLEKFEKALSNFKFEYENHMNDWSFVGSIEHVNSELDNILEHLDKYVMKQLITPDKESDIQ